MILAHVAQEKNTNNVMAENKTNHQVQRLLQKIAEKYPHTDEPVFFTDIHIRLSQESGDLMAYDDDDKELTRVVVEEWINSPMDNEQFYDKAAQCLRQQIEQRETQEGRLGIIEPYNYVLENENGEHVAELYIADDEDTVIIGKPFMEGLDKDLDDFINNLLK